MKYLEKQLAKARARQAQGEKGIAIWVIILVIALIIILGVALSASSTNGKTDLTNTKRAESLAGTVLNQSYNVDSALTIALNDGRMLSDDALTGVFKTGTRVFDSNKIGLSGEVKTPATAMANTTPADFLVNTAGDLFYVDGLTTAVCEQINVKLGNPSPLATLTDEGTAGVLADAGSPVAGCESSTQTYFKKIN